MKKISDEFVIAVGLLLISFFIFQAAIFPTLNKKNLTAAVSGVVKNEYGLKPSTTIPGTFYFKYKFAMSNPPANEKSFDASISLFKDSVAMKSGGAFGQIHDAWGYPLRENAYHSLSKEKLKAREFKSGQRLSGGGVGVAKSDADPNFPGIVNCRANTNVTGYFKAYFEDVALDTNAGYDDVTFGQARQNEACQVLQDISILIKLDQTAVTPDIIFSSDQSIPPNALAAATAYFGYYSVGVDNGSLHKHIISRVDQTPAQGNFDALIMTNFNNIPWDVDSALNPGTYDFYTVMYHEVMHALGFRGLLPAAIATTGDAHLHGTFDAFSYKDNTLANPFFDNVTEFLNVPVGAPPQWFTNNAVVYRGVKNIPGAMPDGTRPVFSPTPWQQGSSLSHFDMARAPGETYVMHPSLPTNTTRPIDADEKEVLCHLGYQVLGVTGCEEETPSAENDTLLLTGSSVCIKPLLNDDSFSGGTLSMNSISLVNIQAGDTITYYTGSTCNLGTLPGANGAKSFMFTPTAVPDPRLMVYENKDSISNRTSFPAQIALVSCNNNPDEYVCNGDFEMEPVTTFNNYIGKLYCGTSYNPGYVIPFWCGELSSDFVNHDSTPLGFWYDLPYDCNSNYAGCNIETPDGSESAAFMMQNPVWRESIVTKLKQDLLAGESYKLTFDVFGVAYAPLPNQMRIQAFIDSGIDNLYLSPNTNTLNFDQMLLNQNLVFNQNSQWTEVSTNFVPVADADSLLIIPNTLGFGNYVGSYYIDNVSIVPAVSGDNDIKGLVYEDQDSDGLMDTNESGLDGVSVGLYEGGNATPLQTTLTTNIPDLGAYEFSNLPDGDYYVALESEGVFSTITEPSQNTGLVPNHDYVYGMNLSGGQTEDNKDFGVVLEEAGVEPVPVDIKITKDLIEPTLSILDRNITWRVRVVNFGPNTATNININDVIPAGLMYVSHTTQNPQETYNPITGVYNIPSLLSGNQTQIQITMKVPQAACGIKTNSAILTSIAETDTNPVNNQSAASIKLKACGNQAVQVK